MVLFEVWCFGSNRFLQPCALPVNCSSQQKAPLVTSYSQVTEDNRKNSHSVEYENTHISFFSVECFRWNRKPISKVSKSVPSHRFLIIIFPIFLTRAICLQICGLNMSPASDWLHPSSRPREIVNYYDSW